jgi:polyisoprenoid-binding protein YceI
VRPSPLDPPRSPPSRQSRPRGAAPEADARCSRGRPAALAVALGGLLATLAAAPARAQAVTPAPFSGGEVTFRFSSTFVGTLVGRAPIAGAAFTGARLDSVRGDAEVRVADIRTNNDARDRHLRETLDAARYPLIRFDLDSVLPAAAAGDSVPARFEGRLTLHGVTRALGATGWVLRRPGGEEVVAAFSLDMRDYGIKPPVRALLLRVSPHVALTARVWFGTPPPAGYDR